MAIEPCERCATPGASCGVRETVDRKEPCVVCGVPTGVRSQCGVPRTFMCGTQTLAVTATGTVREVAPRGAAYGQNLLSEHLVADGLDPAWLPHAVHLWNLTMRRIEYRGAHRTALGILNGTFAHSRIPAVPPWDPSWLAPMPQELTWGHRSWLIGAQKVMPGVDFDLAAFDINGMFLSAAACELGSGAPTPVSEPADEVWRRVPGFVEVAGMESAPWGIQDQWEPGMWVPTVLADYLMDAGASLLVGDALLWTDHRRWLDPHVDLMRAARTALLNDGSPAALAVLAVVKEIWGRMFGGLLASDTYNGGPGLNHGWAMTVPAVGQARMFRNLDKTTVDPTSIAVGIHVDAAWFVLPRTTEAPGGLVLSSGLGKFKPAGRVGWTPGMIAAHHRGDHAAMRKALGS